jgi:hypothetical protein
LSFEIGKLRRIELGLSRRSPAVCDELGLGRLGGLTSLASAWLTQLHQDRTKRLSQDKTGRQKLYKQLIDEASKLYADALVHDEAEVSALVSVYALTNRMRVLSSSAVVEKAPRGRAPEGSGSRKRQLPCVMKAAAGGVPHGSTFVAAAWLRM